MPISTEQWRAGIASIKATLQVWACSDFSVGDFLFCSFYAFARLYLFIFLSIISAPFSVLAASLASTIHCCFRTEVCFALNVQELQSPLQNFIKLNSCFLVLICFLSTWVLENLWENVNQLLHCYAYRRLLQTKLYSIVYFLSISRYMELLYLGKSFPLSGLLLLAGDIESNPGLHYDGCLKFFHWNLNSICAREGIKISLIEAYNSVHKFDVLPVSETMLDSSISDEDIFIAGFSKEVYRSDHPSDAKVGGVCLYFRENLSIKRRTDLELLQEMVVSEIHIERKIILVALYRSPSQNFFFIFLLIYFFLF